ncbi:MAG: hypothetical protein AB8B80_11055 [Marinicellaceae bacterium]
MNTHEECYIGDRIISVSYWIDKEILNIVLKLKELHFKLRGIKIDFISGPKLTIDAEGNNHGLNFSNEALIFNRWDGEVIKVNMSQHNFFKSLMNKIVTEATVLWCNNQWKPRRNKSELYIQEYIIKTENNGCFYVHQQK